MVAEATAPRRENVPMAHSFLYCKLGRKAKNTDCIWKKTRRDKINTGYSIDEVVLQIALKMQQT